MKHFLWIALALLGLARGALADEAAISFALIDAERAYPVVKSLQNGQIVSLMGLKRFSLRITPTIDRVRSVRIDTSIPGALSLVTGRPFSLFGVSDDGAYAGTNATPGRHTIRARAFETLDGTGAPLIEAEISFELTDRPPPTATPRPTAPPRPMKPSHTPSTRNPCEHARPIAVNENIAFPDAMGYGRRTHGGSGRNFRPVCSTTYRIRSLADSGPGTLRECVEAQGPRTCVFEVGGMIFLNDKLTATHPWLTIAGQTAPPPGINLRGSTLVVATSEVIIRHIRLRTGDDPRPSCCKTKSCTPSVALTCTSDPGSRDGLSIHAKDGPLANILVDHVSIAWALDEGLSIVPEKGLIDHLTISNSIIAKGLDRSIHPEASNPNDPGHSKGALIQGPFGVTHLTFARNLLAHNAERNIRASCALGMEFLDNTIYNWGRSRGQGRLFELTNKEGVLHELDLIGNLYIPGPDSYCPETQYKPFLCDPLPHRTDSPEDRETLHAILRVGNGAFNRQSRYYLSQNFGPTRTSAAADEWAIAADNFFSKDRQALLHPEMRASEPIYSSGTRVPATPPLAILTSVGARPGDRDSVDSAIINEVISQNGRIIDCVAPDGSERCAKNAGGWPKYSTTRRPLRISTAPLKDDDRDGYTNLEELLQRAARDVERLPKKR